MHLFSRNISHRDRLIAFFASCFGLGYSPIMPGTCGALLGIAFYVPVALAFPREPLQTILIGGMLGFWVWLTIALGAWAERFYQIKDSGIFVTDEVAGFLMTVFLFHPQGDPLLITLWAFPATRVIDILKVPPAKRLENLPRGWGVVADDLLGSVYTAGLLWIVYLVMPSWFGKTL